MASAIQARTFSTEQVTARLVRGAIAGFVAGLVFIALNSWFVTTMGKPALAPFKTIATLAQGPPPAMATIWIGEAIHSVLSAAFGVGFVILTFLIRRNGLLAAAGLIYGGLLYAVDFQILSRFIPYFSAVLKATNQPFELSVHMVFGALLAVLVARRQTDRRPSDR